MTGTLPRNGAPPNQFWDGDILLESGLPSPQNNDGTLQQMWRRKQDHQSHPLPRVLPQGLLAQLWRHPSLRRRQRACVLQVQRRLSGHSGGVWTDRRRILGLEQGRLHPQGARRASSNRNFERNFDLRPRPSSYSPSFSSSRARVGATNAGRGHPRRAVVVAEAHGPHRRQ